MRDGLRIHTLFVIAPLFGAIACDSVNVGRAKDPEGAPVVSRLVFLDVDNHLITDILDATPVEHCSKYEPCSPDATRLATAADGIASTCIVPEGVDETQSGAGTCTRPLQETPISVGGGEGYQIRVVFNKLLDPSIDAELEKDPVDVPRDADANSIVALIGPDGREVPAQKYWEGQGDNVLTSDPFAAPFGPAIVLKPHAITSTSTGEVGPAALAVGSNYSVRLNTARIKDRDGHLLSSGVDVKSEYSIATEPLYAKGGVSPDFVQAAEVAPTDFFVVTANGEIDPRTVGGNDVTVRNEAGAVIPTAAFVECGDLANLKIVRVSVTGEPVAWEPGTYRINVTGMKSTNGASELYYDSKRSLLMGTFTVAEGAEVTNDIADVTVAPCGEQG